MAELEEMIKFCDYMIKYTQALSDGAEKFVAFLPKMIKQHMSVLAQARLNSSKDEFLGAITLKGDRDVLIIALDSDNWLANAADSGADPFDMKEKHLQSPKAKVSKCVLNPKNKVLSSRGWVKIKDIVPGDMVLTHSGKFREVIELAKSRTEVGQEYTKFHINSEDRSSVGGISKANTDITCPSISLTSDHLVLTKDGWKAAGLLKDGDFVASPSDLKRRCEFCGEPLSINAPFVKFCMNNSCSRKQACKDGKSCNFTDAQRNEAFLARMATMEEKGYFDRCDWGLRDKKHHEVCKKKSSESCVRNISSGDWMPEKFFEEKLKETGMVWEREFQIHTGHFLKKEKKINRYQYIDFYFPEIKTAVELDGKHWHSSPEAKDRDRRKDEWCKENGIHLIRIESHLIYKEYDNIINGLKQVHKNHSGELGVCWVKISRVTHGTINRPDHVYAWKYDIVLDADEHSFCCETVFIHNSGYKYLVIPITQSKGAKGSSTDKGQMFQSLIKQTLTRPKYKSPKQRVNIDGTLDVLQEVITEDKRMQGMYRVQTFSSASAKEKGAKPLNSKHILFRVMSEKYPEKWLHPGIKGAEIFKDTQIWVNGIIESTFMEFLDNEIKEIV